MQTASQTCARNYHDHMSKHGGGLCNIPFIDAVREIGFQTHIAFLATRVEQLAKHNILKELSTYESQQLFAAVKLVINDDI